MWEMFAVQSNCTNMHERNIDQTFIAKEWKNSFLDKYRWETEKLSISIRCSVWIHDALTIEGIWLKVRPSLETKAILTLHIQPEDFCATDTASFCLKLQIYIQQYVTLSTIKSYMWRTRNSEFHQVVSIYYRIPLIASKSLCYMDPYLFFASDY